MYVFVAGVAAGVAADGNTDTAAVASVDAAAGVPSSEKAPEAEPQEAEPEVDLRGALAEHFTALLRQLFAPGSQPGCSVAAADPAPLLKVVAKLPGGEDFCDGGQHDSQEVLRLLLDRLHADLVRGSTGVMI